MKQFKFYIYLLFFCTVKSGFTQSLDTNSIETAVKVILYFDLDVQNIPSREEVECFVKSDDSPFELKYLKSTGFKSFVFISASFSMKDQTVANQLKCGYKINKVNNHYLIAFDLKHRKAYKLRGFDFNDIKRLYQDYLYLNSTDFPKKKKKKFFKSNFTIEGFDFKNEL